VQRAEYTKKFFSCLGGACPTAVFEFLGLTPSPRVFPSLAAPMVPVPGLPTSKNNAMVSNAVWIAAMAASLSLVLGFFSSDALLVDLVSGGMGVEVRGSGFWSTGPATSVVALDFAAVVEVLAVAGFLAILMYMLANSMSQQVTDLLPGDALNYSQDTLDVHALQALQGTAMHANIAGETDPLSLNLKMRALEVLLADYQGNAVHHLQEIARQAKGNQHSSTLATDAVHHDPSAATAAPFANGKVQKTGGGVEPTACPSSSRPAGGSVLSSNVAGAPGGGLSSGRQTNPPTAAAAAPAALGTSSAGGGVADVLVAGAADAGARGAAQALVERELKEKDLKDLKEAQR